MPHEISGPRRRYYGIAEIADALGVDRQLVTVWRRRSSHGLPAPDEELSSGPVWEGVRIEPWIAATRARLENERAGRASGGPDPELARRVARRFFRLMAVLLEEPVRPQALQRALEDLAQLRAPLARVSGVPDRIQRSVGDVLVLCEVAEQALASGRPVESLCGQLLATYLAGVAQVTRLVARFE